MAATQKIKARVIEAQAAFDMVNTLTVSNASTYDFYGKIDTQRLLDESRL
jgi:hypothetical protein